jgi:hypothetical protein
MARYDDLGTQLVTAQAFAFRYFQPGSRTIVKAVAGEIHPDGGHFTAWCASRGVTSIDEVADHRRWASPVPYATVRDAVDHVAIALAHLDAVHIIIEDFDGGVLYDSLADCGPRGAWLCIRDGNGTGGGLHTTRHLTATDAALAGLAYRARSREFDCLPDVCFRVEKTSRRFD